MARILLAEDHTLVRSGIRSLLERSRDLAIVGEAADGREAVQLARVLGPDLAVLDVAMAKLNGITREAQDQFALRSQERALAAQASGVFTAEIVQVVIPGKKVSLLHDRPLALGEGLLRPVDHQQAI